MAFSKENVAFFLNFAKFKIAGGDFCASGRLGSAAGGTAIFCFLLGILYCFLCVYALKA